MSAIDETAGIAPEDAAPVDPGAGGAAQDPAPAEAPEPGTIRLPDGAVLTLATDGDSYVIRGGDFVRIEREDGGA